MYRERWLRLLVLAVSFQSVLLACSGSGGNDAPPVGVSVLVAPASSVLKTGQSLQFVATVLGSDDTGVLWSASAGSISSTGLFVAPASVGTVTIVATSRANSQVQGSAVATVTLAQPITVTVSPQAAVLDVGERLRFSATITGTDNGTVTWLASSGSIDSLGEFTAALPAGPVTITAISSADPQTQGTATLTVVATAPTHSAYDQAVLADHPVAYWPHSNTEPLADASGNGHNSRFLPAGVSPAFIAMPNADRAIAYNGFDQYLEIPDHDALSIVSTGVLTVEAWLRPQLLEFPRQEGSGYVHWLGKGMAGQHEYVLRMYSYTNIETPPRPNRISAYAFNLAGGLGSGSYFQDPINASDWLQVTVVYDSLTRSTAYPSGSVRIYKNGVLRDTTGLDQFQVVPQNGSAPLRIGTRNLASFFAGAIGKVALYNYALSETQIRHHHQQMCASAC